MEGSRAGAGECFDHGAILSQFFEQRTHGARVDGRIIPAHAVASGDKVATDLPVGHATDELPPGRLILSGELNTRLSGVVQELIVLDPEGGVPGFVVGVTVHGGSFG